MAKAKQLLDSLLSYLISKKLFVFIVACVFLCLSLIGEESWLYIALIYLGVQGIIDTAIKLPLSKPDTNKPSSSNEQEYS